METITENIQSPVLTDFEKLAVEYRLQHRYRMATPLQVLLGEAEKIVKALDPCSVMKSSFETKLMSGDPVVDLENRLARQAQSLDGVYALFLQLAQYSLHEDADKVPAYLQFALKAQSQSASTIDKFRRLHEKSVKNAERKEETAKRKEENDNLD